MIEPDRHTAPGEIAARTRVQALFERIDELGPDMLALPVPGFDLDARDIALAELESMADRHGRKALLDEVRRHVRDGLARRLATRQVGYPLGQNLVESGTVEDQVARMMAVEDAVSVAVVEDLIDAETVAALSAPGRRLLGLAPLEQPGDPDAADIDGPRSGPDIPAADDDANGEEEDADEDLEDPEAASGRRQQRVALIVALGLITLLITWSNGVALPLIAVVLLAAALVAWLFA